MNAKSKLIVIFDLDDTLYNEVDYLESAYQEIANFLSIKINKAPHLIFTQMLNYYKLQLNVFDEILKLNGIGEISIQDLLKKYRYHIPNIKLTSNTERTLSWVKHKAYKVGLITDGRSIQQRNKLKALGLEGYFDDIIISEEFGTEKPNIQNFKFFSDIYGNSYAYMYIGDNTKKDFIAPNELGWYTVCLKDNGKNIHQQSFDINSDIQPKYIIKELSELEKIISDIE
ncbi:HAD family hydrolase [Mariniflexile sp.]|uniref:HAD family hydrolase n=1 Tax=Mariniflexile sp. TaxID=1979402 RepID=UPI0035678F36